MSMAFFCYIVYELLVGLATAAAQEADPEIRGKIQTAQVMTVISWCTYPVVCLFPMLRINAAADLSGMKEDLGDTKEPLTLADTIKILNDDDALEPFKKRLLAPAHI